MNLDSALLAIHGWMAIGSTAATLGCFLWGAASTLFSPCHLASIPLMVGFVAGQHGAVTQGRATVFTLFFCLGLFLSIAMVGFLCTAMGRLLGDVGPYGTLVPGILLLWTALDMLGLAKCSLSGGILTRWVRLRGIPGAFLLGLAYGLLSGACTFGFLAPILALVATQTSMATSTAYILAFAIGHCLPVLLAGSCAAAAQRLVAASSWQQGALWLRRGAGVLMACLGGYFLAMPFAAA